MEHEPLATPRRSPVGAAVGGLVGVAFGALTGAAIGYGVVDVGCTGSCTEARWAGALLGASAGTAGITVVVVLAMRAFVEWRRQSTRSPS